MDFYIISFQIKVRKVECDFELGRRVDFPWAVFVAGVKRREAGAGDGSVGHGEQTAAGICENEK